LGLLEGESAWMREGEEHGRGEAGEVSTYCKADGRGYLGAREGSRTHGGHQLMLLRGGGDAEEERL